MGRLDGKVCIVTGASGGIGAKTAEFYGREGAKVVLAARRENYLNAVAKKVRDAGGEALVVVTDIRDKAQAEALVEKTVSNIKAVKARGASVILVTNDDALREDPEICDHLVRVPRCPAVLSPSLSIVPMQLLAYYVSVMRGCDVDKPRNLAKSVTVE